MSNDFSFQGYAIVSCGTLALELNYLRSSGFLDPDKILYTIPGLHENPRELKKDLLRQMHRARQYSSQVIVIYGSRCYIDPIDPAISIDKIIEAEMSQVTRINAKNCIDMLVSAEEKERISNGKKVYWLSPGWLKYWKQIFKDWDAGLANETFPRNDKAIVLDALGFFDKYAQDTPEKLLEFSDWTKIPIEAHQISLDRLKELLVSCIIRSLQKEISELQASIPPHSVPPSMLQRLEELEQKLNLIQKNGY